MAAGAAEVEKVAVVEHFDPKSVPLMKWSDYENDYAQKDVEDANSVTTYQTGYTKEEYSRGTSAPTASAYTESNYGVPVRNMNRDSYMSIGIDHIKRSSNVGPPPFAAIDEAPVPFPSDEEILAEVRHILSTTDLMKVTKKSVRDQLTRLFGVDLTPKKEYIHKCIDGILKGEL
jgi:chitin synthase